MEIKLDEAYIKENFRGNRAEILLTLLRQRDSKVSLMDTLTTEEIVNILDKRGRKVHPSTVASVLSTLSKRGLINWSKTGKRLYYEWSLPTTVEVPVTRNKTKPKVKSTKPFKVTSTELIDIIAIMVDSSKFEDDFIGHMAFTLLAKPKKKFKITNTELVDLIAALVESDRFDDSFIVRLVKELSSHG